MKNRIEDGKLSYMPLYFTDLIGSHTWQILNNQERLAFIMLLGHAWNSARPPYLVNDVDKLWKLSGMRLKSSFESMMTKLQSGALVTTECGRWRFNPKQLEIHAQCMEAVCKSQDAGKKAAAARWQNNGGHSMRPHSERNAIGMPTNTKGIESKPTATRKPEENSSKSSTTQPQKPPMPAVTKYIPDGALWATVLQVLKTEISQPDYDAGFRDSYQREVTAKDLTVVALTTGRLTFDRHAGQVEGIMARLGIGQELNVEFYTSLAEARA